MRIPIVTDKRFGEIYLTDESPESRDGIPVLHAIVGSLSFSIAASTIIGHTENSETPVRGADMVAAWAIQPGLTERELDAAQRYLATYLEGPQL